MPQSLRITELTPEDEETLFNLVADGNYPAVACAAVGISVTQYSNWIKRGEGRSRDHAATPEYVAFATKMRQAEAKAEVHAVQKVKEGMDKNPELGLKYLGRRFRERWGEVVTHKNDWTITAITMLKNGDVKWADLQGTFDADALAEIKTRLLESGETGEWEEVQPQDEKVEVNAE